MPNINKYSQENIYKIAVLHFPKIGPARYKRISARIKSFKEFFTGSRPLLISILKEEPIVDEFIAWRKNIEPEKLIEKFASENIDTVFIEDDTYPEILKTISDAPPLLYFKGILPPGNRVNIAIVGSRLHSAYGRQAAEKISSELSSNSIKIISGMALGIDSFAHDACLNTGGYTAAVIGSGLDRASIYPIENLWLFDKIISLGGAVISEYPPLTPPLKHNFPQRNRIIAGLSKGVVVIEAKERSGALITARLALEYGRDVFAVPGSIFSFGSKGANLLIKEGANLVSCAKDILEILEFAYCAPDGKKQISPAPENAQEAKILEILTHEPLHIDELIRAIGLDTSKIISILTIMEMKGMVKNLGNMEYVII